MTAPARLASPIAAAHGSATIASAGLAPPAARRRPERADAADTPRASRAHCLLIDPDATRRRGIQKYLSLYALEVRGAGSPKVARAWMVRERFDAIILNDALPDAGGIALLRWLRRSYAGPILLVARLDESAKIVALETGACDVVDEACSRRELAARVRAQLRLRHEPAPASAPAQAVPPSARTSIRFHDLSLDLVHRRLASDVRGAALRLAEAEFRLLCCLLLADGQVLGRDQLLGSVYAGQVAVDERTVDVGVSRLRKAIRSVSSAKDVLVTVRGQGYRIDRPVDPPPAEPRAPHHEVALAQPVPQRARHLQPDQDRQDQRDPAVQVERRIGVERRRQRRA